MYHLQIDNISVMLLLVLFYILPVKTHVCFLKKRADPANFRWSLPYKELCSCQRLMVATVFFPPRCNDEEDYETDDLWFIDNPAPLMTKSNWKKHRVQYCECKSPLGMESGAISDSQITASTENGDSHAKNGRLHIVDNRWKPRPDDPHKWIKVDLLSAHTLTGIVMQGYDTWVETVSVAYEMPVGSGTLVNITDGGGDTKIFQACTDKTTPVEILFDEPVYTSIIQVQPESCKSTEGWCPVRLEILGC